MQNLINKIATQSEWISRSVIALIYIWFGSLKIFGLSPAGQLVHDLFDKTIGGFIEFNTFFILFSFFEVVIGILFLVPKLTKIATVLIFLHIFTTFGPLIFLMSQTWSNFLVPTLEGQYVLKNFVLIALVISIYKSRFTDTNYG